MTASASTPAAVSAARWVSEMRPRPASHIASPIANSCQRHMTKPFDSVASHPVAPSASRTGTTTPAQASVGSAAG